MRPTSGNSTDPRADAERLARAYQAQYPAADVALYALPRSGGWGFIVLLADERRAINGAFARQDLVDAMIELAALSGHVSMHGHTSAAVRLGDAQQEKEEEE